MLKQTTYNIPPADARCAYCSTGPTTANNMRQTFVGLIKGWVCQPCRDTSADRSRVRY